MHWGSPYSASERQTQLKYRNFMMTTLNTLLAQFFHAAGIALIGTVLLLSGLSMGIIATYWNSSKLFLWGG